MNTYLDTCIFCQIASGKMDTSFVAESDNVVAFNDIAPISPVHVLIVPKAHVESAQHLGVDHTGVWQEMLDLAQSIATSTGVAESGYRLVTNIGSDGGQEVMHLHVHLLGGKKQGRLG
jgi:histidine triad (HIT) family protein